MDQAQRLERTLAAIDAVHALDPVTIERDGQTVAAELDYAQRMSRWLTRLAAAPPAAVTLAVRAQHLRRWQLHRDAYPAGRAGYLAWRAELARRGAAELAALMQDHGWSQEDVDAAVRHVRKQNLRRDAGTQILEDVACLVFLEGEFAAFAPTIDEDKMVDILQKSWAKMSPAAQKLALALAIDPALRRLVERALAGTSA
jgi:hypothetical protein